MNAHNREVADEGFKPRVLFPGFLLLALTPAVYVTRASLSLTFT